MVSSPSQKDSPKAAGVADIMAAIADLAPSAMAESWDNVGMQIGHGQDPVQRVWVSLDPLSSVVEAACADQADLLICHHPLTIKGIKQVDFASEYGRIVRMCAENRLAIVAAHTNLDAAQGGLNDIWAAQLGIDLYGPLAFHQKDRAFKLVVFVPLDAETRFLEAFSRIQGVGRIGNYDMCTFRGRGVGTFRPNWESQPYTGTIGEFNQVEEVRIETVVPSYDVERVLAACRQAHPYETMAYDLYPLRLETRGPGIGRVGMLPRKTTLEKLAQQIKKKMNLHNLRMVGDPDLNVEKVALCTGSGGSMLPDFFKSGTQVFVTGDLRYHDAREIEQRGCGAIDVGHFASEHIVVPFLARYLRGRCKQHGWLVDIHACEIEEDPFCMV